MKALGIVAAVVCMTPLLEGRAAADTATCRIDTTSRRPMPGKVCEYGMRDCNPYLRDPVDAVTRLVSYGELLGFHRGPYPDLSGASPFSQSHWQGAARPMRIAGTKLDGRYFVTTSSHAPVSLNPNPPPGTIEFIRPDIARFGITHFDGAATPRRWGTNRFFTGHDSWTAAPPSTDATIAKVDLTQTHHWHPGGIQAIGQYLFIGVENSNQYVSLNRYSFPNPHPLPQNSMVVAYDMSSFPHATPLFQLPMTGDQSDQASAVGVAKLADDSYLMVVGGRDTNKLTFYRSTGCELTDKTTWTFLTTYDARTNVPGWPSGSEPGYQALHLVTDQSGGLFLVGTWKDDSGFPAYSGTDKVDLYRLSIGCSVPSVPPAPPAPPPVITVARVATRSLYCSSPQAGSGLQCNLDAAVGVYIDDEHRLIVYATEHGMNGAGSSTRMKEFRSLPSLTEHSCTRIEDAWIEIYQDADFGGRTVVIDHAKRAAPYLTHFSQMDSFNDHASSVRWCFPAGHGFTLFEDADRKGPSFTFAGNGQMQAQSHLDNVRFAGTNTTMNDRASSGQWF